MILRISAWSRLCTAISSKEKAADGKDWSASAKAGSRIAAGKSAGNMPQSVRLVIAIFISTRSSVPVYERGNWHGCENRITAVDVARFYDWSTSRVKSGVVNNGFRKTQYFNRTNVHRVA